MTEGVAQFIGRYMAQVVKSGHRLRRRRSKATPSAARPVPPRPRDDKSVPTDAWFAGYLDDPGPPLRHRGGGGKGRRGRRHGGAVGGEGAEKGDFAQDNRVTICNAALKSPAGLSTRRRILREPEILRDFRGSLTEGLFHPPVCALAPETRSRPIGRRERSER